MSHIPLLDPGREERAQQTLETGVWRRRAGKLPVLSTLQVRQCLLWHQKGQVCVPGLELSEYRAGLLKPLPSHLQGSPRRCHPLCLHVVLEFPSLSDWCACLPPSFSGSIHTRSLPCPHAPTPSVLDSWRGVTKGQKPAGWPGQSHAVRAWCGASWVGTPDDGDRAYAATTQGPEEALGLEACGQSQGAAGPCRGHLWCRNRQEAGHCRQTTGTGKHRRNRSISIGRQSWWAMTCLFPCFKIFYDSKYNICPSVENLENK